jgi:hypothetical protein
VSACWNWIFAELGHRILSRCLDWKLIIVRPIKGSPWWWSKHLEHICVNNNSTNLQHEKDSLSDQSQQLFVAYLDAKLLSLIYGVGIPISEF